MHGYLSIGDFAKLRDADRYRSPDQTPDIGRLLQDGQKKAMERRTFRIP